MQSNPFGSFTLDIPNKYRDSVLSYSRTGGNKNSPEIAPFRRQVDFWYAAFLVGIAKNLEPEPDPDSYNATPGTIFSSDPFRIDHMQIAFLGRTNDLKALSNPRAVFDFCLGVANAGMPYLIQVLADPDDRPLWALFDELEMLTP